MTREVLVIRNLGIRLGPEFAIVLSALRLRAGEVLVLDAPSGAGKSTVLGLIAGALPASDLPGRVLRLCGADLLASDLRRTRADLAGPRQLGFVLQTSRLVPFLTLRENVTLPMRLAGGGADPVWQAALFDRLGIGPILDRRPDQVSVGQRQRAAVARALLARPALLLLDEPVSALDPANIDAVEGLIVELAAEAGSAVLLASHQAARGAFAAAPRGTHRVERDAEGVTVSLFSDGPGALPLREVA